MAWITLKPSGLGSVLCMECGAELPQADHHKPPYTCESCTPSIMVLAPPKPQRFGCQCECGCRVNPSELPICAYCRSAQHSNPRPL